MSKSDWRFHEEYPYCKNLLKYCRCQNQDRKKKQEKKFEKEDFKIKLSNQTTIFDFIRRENG